MYTLTLRRSNGWWCVTDDDPRTRELFGTDTLPTAYTDVARPSEVLEAIQRLNPESTVVLEREA